MFLEYTTSIARTGAPEVQPRGRREPIRELDRVCFERSRLLHRNVNNCARETTSGDPRSSVIIRTNQPIRTITLNYYSPARYS